MARRLFALLLAVCAAAGRAETPLAIDCRGNGPTVMLVGGGPAFTSRHLEPVQTQLAERYRVCRWDMRGVGANAGVALEPGRSALSQWLTDMADVLPNERVVLWGHSWGALQALLFAQRFPQRVQGLVLSNPVDPGLRSLTYIERKRFHHPDAGPTLQLEEIGSRAEELHHLRSKIASYFLNGEQGWSYAARFTPNDSNRHLNVAIWAAYRAAPLDEGDVRSLGPKIAGLIHCREDVLQPESLAEYRRLLPAHAHVVLAGCAHFPWEETPDAYFDALLPMVEGAWR